MAVQQEDLGILLTQDLIFSLKVTGTARAMGLRVTVVGDTARVEELCRQEQPGCVLIDLGIPALNVAEKIKRLRAAAGGAPLIAFGAHVHREVLESAAAAGCNEVYPRSKFSRHLADLLQRHLAASAPVPVPSNDQTLPPAEYRAPNST